MEISSSASIERLRRKGVRIPAPETVEIGQEVDPDRISGKNVILHAGCRLFGAATLVSEGACIGSGAPVTIEDCWIGPDVRLEGGYFQRAVFLAGASAGFGAHVREGTILEEQAGIAHTVGLKQTILFPYVTLGSLINFCDCLMAGGTDRKNHSEVGSSYIHFNYTPNQDKATASLIGDVPKGVMLRQPPIFLGGQGGLVGPCRLAFGTVIAAGTIQRKDEFRPGRLIFGGQTKPGNVPFTAGKYHGHKRIIANNFAYIANLVALENWYRVVRSQFVGSSFPAPLLEGLLQTLGRAFAERVHRLEELGDRMAAGGSGKAAEFGRHRTEIRDYLHLARSEKRGQAADRDAFLVDLQAAIQRDGNRYLEVIQGLSAEQTGRGSRWLQGIVDQVVEGACDIVPMP